MSYVPNTGTADAPAYDDYDGAASGCSSGRLDAGLVCDGAVPLAVAGHAAPTTADLDGDGDLDAIIGSLDGTLSYWENVGTPTDPVFEAVDAAASPVGGIRLSAFSHPALWDTDGDGDYDLVVGAADGQLHYFENVGTPAVPEYTPRDSLPDGLDGHFDGESVRLHCWIGVPKDMMPPNDFWKGSPAEATVGGAFDAVVTDEIGLQLESLGLRVRQLATAAHLTQPTYMGAHITFEIYVEAEQEALEAAGVRLEEAAVHCGDRARVPLPLAGAAAAITAGGEAVEVLKDEGLKRIYADGSMHTVDCPLPPPPSPSPLIPPSYPPYWRRTTGLELSSTGLVPVTAVGLSSPAPAFGEIDGDGTTEMVLGGALGELVVFDSGADGTLTPVPEDQSPAAEVELRKGAMPAVGDADGLHDVADVIVGAVDGTLTLLHNSGGGGPGSLARGRRRGRGDPRRQRQRAGARRPQRRRHARSTSSATATRSRQDRSMCQMTAAPRCDGAVADCSTGRLDAFLVCDGVRAHGQRSRGADDGVHLDGDGGSGRHRGAADGTLAFWNNTGTPTDPAFVAAGGDESARRRQIDLAASRTRRSGTPTATATTTWWWARRTASSTTLRMWARRRCRSLSGGRRRLRARRTLRRRVDSAPLHRRRRR